ncbi:MAG: P-loop NTPase fold protein, partial [Clostridium botulinum]|nr:P-loop NTPase fold protein [Clostridium botulinum]
MYNFFNDIESEIDYLGYNPYIEAFNYLLINNSELITPPVVFGIHGKWGTGKSTFMKLIKNKLDKDFYTIAINPWEYGENQNFITIFLAKLYNNKEVKKNIFSKENDSAINFLKCIFKPLKLSVDVKPLKLEYDFNKFSLDEQKNVIDSFISENFALKESISYILNHNFFSKKKIVVFIDDLDRCSVKKIMEVIESIKLIFNSPNCIFFLGCDTNYIESALSIEYEKFIENNEKLNFDFKSFSREYLEKIIQIPFYIPSISEKAVRGYIDSILYSKKDQYKPIKVKENLFNSFRLNLKGDFISDLIVKSNLNPRRIKRILNLTFLNYIFMKFKNNEQKNFNIDTKLLSLLCVTREVYPG